MGVWWYAAYPLSTRHVEDLLVLRTAIAPPVWRGAGMLASIPRTPGGTEAAFTPVEVPGPPLSRTLLDKRR